MAWRVHALVQNSNDNYSVGGDAKVHHVPLNAPSTVTRSDVLNRWCHPGRVRQHGKSSRQSVDVATGLIDPPLADGVGSDRLQVALGDWRQPIFSHAPQASSA